MGRYGQVWGSDPTGPYSLTLVFFSCPTRRNQWSADISPAEIVRVENLRDDLVARLGTIPPVARKEYLPRDRDPWRPYYSKVNYEFLVDLYHDVLPDLMYGYIDDAIPPKQARIYGRVDF